MFTAIIIFNYYSQVNTKRTLEEESGHVDHKIDYLINFY